MELEPKLFEEQVPRAADSYKITNTVWRWGLVEEKFERKTIDAERDLLHEKNLLKALRRELHFVNEDGDVYFQVVGSEELDGALHHSMMSKKLLYIEI